MQAILRATVLVRLSYETVRWSRWFLDSGVSRSLKIVDARSLARGEGGGGGGGREGV